MNKTSRSLHEECVQPTDNVGPRALCCSSMAIVIHELKGLSHQEGRRGRWRAISVKKGVYLVWTLSVFYIFLPVQRTGTFPSTLINGQTKHVVANSFINYKHLY
jgi:hypothetical protein